MDVRTAVLGYLDNAEIKMRLKDTTYRRYEITLLNNFLPSNKKSGG